MRNVALSFAVAIIAALILQVMPASAQTNRAFVSSTGTDSGSCPAATPCRTFAFALMVTNTGGEIVTLDPGGYGAVTINKQVAIIGVPGAEVTAQSGNAGITIQVSQGTTVYISNVQVTGDGAANTTGIAVNSGSLILNNSALRLLTTGLQVNSTSPSTGVRADLFNSDIVGNTTGILTNGTGVVFNINVGYQSNACTSTSVCQTIVRINGGNVVDNTTAFVENNAGNVSNSASATIWTFANNNSGGGNTNVAGYTTLMTSNSAPSTSGLVSYNSGFAPY